jgi:hypothetical protein
LEQRIIRRNFDELGGVGEEDLVNRFFLPPTR